MAKQKQLNVAEQISLYDNDEFFFFLSLKNVTNTKELRNLLTKLENAYRVVTSFYETMYNDYIMMINSDSIINPSGLEISTLKKYKSLASKIQKAYNYILYISMFDSPFKTKVRK